MHDHHAKPASLNRVALSATVHCLTGCAIGEVLGMVIGVGLGWSNLATVVLSVVLAFLFGYSLTLVPLLRAGMAFGAALGLALAADTVSVAVMPSCSITTATTDRGLVTRSRATRWRGETISLGVSGLRGS